VCSVATEGSSRSSRRRRTPGRWRLLAFGLPAAALSLAGTVAGASSSAAQAPGDVVSWADPSPLVLAAIPGATEQVGVLNDTAVTVSATVNSLGPIAVSPHVVRLPPGGQTFLVVAVPVAPTAVAGGRLPGGRLPGGASPSWSRRRGPGRPEPFCAAR